MRIANVFVNGDARRPTSLTYPDGRVVTYNYWTASGIDDACSRVKQLVDSDGGSTVLAEQEYLGLSGIVEVDHPQPDLQYTLIDPSGSTDPDTGDIYSGPPRADCCDHDSGIIV